MGSLDKIGIAPLKTASLNQAAPVQNTWYTICDLSSVQVHSLDIAIITTGETLELRVTIEGVVLGTLTQVAVAGTDYQISLVCDYTGGLYLLAGGGPSGPFGYVKYPLPCGRFKAELRKTTNAGGGNLRGSVVYNQ